MFGSIFGGFLGSKVGWFPKSAAGCVGGCLGGVFVPIIIVLGVVVVVAINLIWFDDTGSGFSEFVS